MSENNFIPADWTRKDIAFENNKLNEEYFKDGSYKNFPSYFKLKEAIQYIIDNESKFPLNLLDIGCGSGWYAVYLEKEGIDKFLNYSGTDLSQHMCDNALKNYPNGKFFVADVGDKSFPGHDIVMEAAVIELVLNWENSIRNMLKSSNKWFITHRLFFKDGKTETTNVSTYLNLKDIRHTIGLDDLNKILQEENFEIVKIDEWNSSSYRMGTFIMRKKQC